MEGRPRPGALQAQYMHYWHEVRLQENRPERRSYHSAVAHNGSVYVYGGQDLREGVFSGLWILHIDPHDDSHDYWEKLETTGVAQAPQELCRQTAVIWEDQMYLFGGTNNTEESNVLYVFNVSTKHWVSHDPVSAQLPPPMDSHSAVVSETGQPAMVVFGGFQNHDRSNQVFAFDLTGSAWRHQPCSGQAPAARCGHTAVVYSNQMYVLGGTDALSDRLNDFWSLDLATFTWSRVQEQGTLPDARAGHSALAFQDTMLIFGGISDITREANDMFSFDFSTSTWALLQERHQVEDPVTPAKLEEYKKKKQQKVGKSPSLNTVSTPAAPTENTLTVRRKKQQLYDGPVTPERGHVGGKIPHGRDGHSATIVSDYMVIFGGDRHQMPFNDIYIYRLEEEVVKTPINV